MFFFFFIFFFHSKDVTKPRNKTKEFLFNLVFFLILPFLPLLKLCKKIAKCCKKAQDSKKDTKAQDKSEEGNDNKGTEVEIFKDENILTDGRLPAQSGLSSEQLDIKRGNKGGIMSAFKRRLGGASGNEGNIASSGTPRGSKHEMAAPESRRSSEKTAGEPSTSSRGIGNQDRRSSEKTAEEPSASSRGTGSQDRRSSEKTAGEPSTSSRGSGSQDRRSSEKTAGEPSTSSRGTGSPDKAQVTTTSHSYTNITVEQEAVPSPPQVGNILVSMLL